MDPRRRAIGKILRAWLRLQASMRHMGRGMRRQFGASDNALMLLRVLVETEPVSIGELAELTGYHVASLGQMLERMEESGWIERQRDEADRRKVVLRSTERGRELVQQAPLFGPWRLGAFAEKLTDSQLEELSAGFDWLSDLFSPPVSKEDDMHCGTRRRNFHIQFGPGGLDFEHLGEHLGERFRDIFGGGGFPGFGFSRRFRSRRERLERLESYLADLKSEAEAVQEKINELKREGDEPSSTV